MGSTNVVTGEAERWQAFAEGYVFDVSQTDGEPLPEPPKVSVLEGDEGGVLYAHLAGVAADERLNLYERRCFNPEGAIGFQEPGRAITVRESYQLQMTKTLAHELSHAFTGHYETYDECREEHEAIAEATACITLKHSCLDSAARSVPYISGRSKDRAVFRELLGTNQFSAHAIISRVNARAVIDPASMRWATQPHA